MNRLSFRPRPLDIHKKLPIVKSIKEFEDDEGPTTASTRNSQLLWLSAETDNEVQQPSSKKNSSEIPIPKYNVVDTYERDYSCTFSHPTSYLRVRGARAELGEFVEYDLDDEDEDWLQGFSKEKKTLSPEKFEALLFKLEVFDHKTRERAGIIGPTFGSPVPVLLQLDAAAEALQAQLSVRSAVFHSVYDYWKAKREQWQKPILRRLQPPPPVNDTNPYNVFRPREKAHRLHTRRMQRRENNVQSFDKLRQISPGLLYAARLKVPSNAYDDGKEMLQKKVVGSLVVRRNLDRARTVLEALIKREEKKRDVLESEVSLQRIQIKYKHEAQLVEDGLFPGVSSDSFKFDSSDDDDDLTDSDDAPDGYRRANSAAPRKPPFINSRQIVVPTGHAKRELKQRKLRHGWPRRRDLNEPVFLFTRAVDPGRLASAGIAQPFCCRGRIGRGGRIIFDRGGPPNG